MKNLIILLLVLLFILFFALAPPVYAADTVSISAATAILPVEDYCISLPLVRN